MSSISKNDGSEDSTGEIPIISPSRMVEWLRTYSSNSGEASAADTRSATDSEDTPLDGGSGTGGSNFDCAVADNSWGGGGSSGDDSAAARTSDLHPYGFSVAPPR
jgi:hypothetical protein